MTLSDLSIKRPVLATVMILILVALGVSSAFTLKVNDFPNFDIPYVTVTITEPGVSAQQIENDVTKRVEDAVSQVSGVKHITSYSNDSISTVLIEFTMETSQAEATQNVRDKISASRGDLPDDIDEPIITKLDINSQPIVSLAVGGSLSARELTNLVDDQIKPQLQKVNGVGEIDTYGYSAREIQINLNKDKLVAYGLTTTQVLSSLANENMDVPGGNLKSGKQQITVRTAGKLNKVEQFLNLPVAKVNGVQLYVKDVAEVVDGTEEQDSLGFYQGQPAIAIDLIKQSGSNTVSVADDAKKAVDELKQQLPPGVTIDLVRDNSVMIKDSVSDVQNSIVLGSLLAVIVIFMFLKDWRSTLISAVSLPTSIISTFFIFNMMGYTLNNVTLMALSLSVGLLVDDAIVVIENIIRHLHLGKKPLAAAQQATSEITLAVMTTTLTLVAVFLPIALTTGLMSKLFKPFALTVVFAVLVSLLVSFTLVPMLSSRTLRLEERLPKILLVFLNWFNGLFEKLGEVYYRLLAKLLKRRLVTMIVVVALLFGSFSLIPKLGVEFIPQRDEGELNIVGTLDSGLNLAAAGNINSKILEIINKNPEVVKTFSTVTTSKVSYYVKLVDKSERKRTAQQIAAVLRKDLQSLPGVQSYVCLNSAMGSALKTVSFNLMGDDREQLQAYAVQAQRIMSSIPGAVDVSSSYRPGQPEVKLQIKRDAANDLGVSTAQAGSVINTMLTGTVVGHYEDGDDRYDVRVRLAEGNRKNLDDLRNIYLLSQNASASGGTNLISLNQVCDKVFSSSPSTLEKYDKSKKIELSCNLDGVTQGDFNSAFSKKVAQELNLPAGYKLFAGGTSEMMTESFGSLGQALILGVLFMFFVIAAQFESFIDPLAVLLSLPLAIIGAIIGLLVGGSHLSMMSMMGIIMLIGLVAKNAILLIDFAKAEIRRGTERSEALIIATRIRFRPIMMTALVMVTCMLPTAFAFGQGAELRAPMAQAIIGGMITSTLLTMIIVPIVYSLLDDMKRVFSRKPSAKHEEKLHTVL
ncbi:MAG: Multidrug resistance protein MdtC [Pelotomaculum sp. PtaU1.Bin065]|nr:MAG: Multidrug resistance protein MdtC [Pelotomaculum sp. PtaU1.Bin065]